VSLYAKAAGLAESEAEAAVSALVVPELAALYRQMPLAAVGFVISALVMAAFAAGAAYGVANAGEGLGFVVLALGCAALLLRRRGLAGATRIVRQARATVRWFGYATTSPSAGESFRYPRFRSLPTSSAS
jgi:hypothetical protein